MWLGDIIVGIISFRRNIKFSLKNSFKKRLLVFDIQPVRSSFYQSMVYDYEYQIPDIAISFLDHIDMLAKKFDLEIILKRKITTNVTDKKYLNKVNKLFSSGRWIDLNPDYDASLVIEKIKPIGSISAPYSSTAIITENKDILTIYYDSTSKIDVNFEANNNIVVLKNIEELSNWTKTLLN